ncbi:MAG: TonB-dependent receptor [Caldithrix sp.]|nr:MAG: TonB-dependent receptor [Caldithrix sp.]
MRSHFLGVFLIITIISAGHLFAGITGKISGRVTDTETGDGLPGANVQIEGTRFGAAADANGHYTILNVPPGLYTVKMSFIGYQGVLVKEVRVNVDFTTRVDQGLNPSAVEMDAVVVFGERHPLIREDLTNTLVAVTAEQIDALPVDQIRDVIALQAGVTTDNSGNLHIRGGRSNEIAYQVNGLSINNPLSSTQGIGLATNAIEEVSVSAGTFSAEYGNALSGVINFVTKDGGQEYHGSFKGWTGDHFSTRDEIFFNIDEIDLFNNTRMEWTFGGPVPLFGDNLTFFVSGVRQKDNGHLYGIRVYNPEEISAADPGTGSFTIDAFGNGQADGDGEIVPMVTSESLNLTAKLSWRPTATLKFSYDLIFEDSERFNRTVGGVNIYRRFRFTPDGRPKTFANGQSHSFGITHTLNNKTFYTVKLGINNTRSRSSVFENVFDPRLVPSFNNNIGNNILPNTGYVAGGMDLRRFKSKARSYIAKVDIVSQVSPSHEVKFGGEFTYHDIESQFFELLYDEAAAEFFIPNPEVNPDFTEFQFINPKPIQAAFYLLDKMELAKNFILNVGLRYQFLDTRGIFNGNLANTVEAGVANPEFLQDASPKHRLSPRISLSFPITDRGVIRFSYGQFYQNPIFSSIFSNPRFVDFDFRTTPSFGNSNLDPQRSTQYELGLQQQFTENLKVDLTVYYKDVNNLIETRRIIAGDVALTKEFNVVTSIGYASVKGITVSLLKRRSPGGILSSTLDYTFQVAEGTFTNPLRLAVDTRTGRQAEQELVPLSYDRTHTINATLTVAKAGNWRASAIGTVQAGTPYTPSVPSSVQPVVFDVNSDRRPWNTRLDLKLEKFLRVQGMRFSVFMQVENAFDQKIERFIHTNTGRSLTNLNETINPNLFNEIESRIVANPDNFFPLRFIEDFYQREDWLAEPREIRWGFTFRF